MKNGGKKKKTSCYSIKHVKSWQCHRSDCFIENTRLVFSRLLTFFHCWLPFHFSQCKE